MRLRSIVAVIGAVLSAVAFVLWKLFANRSTLDHTATKVAVARLGYLDMTNLKTPEEHRAKFQAAVDEARSDLEKAKAEEIKARFAKVFGGER